MKGTIFSSILFLVVLYSSFALKENGWQAQKVGVPHWEWLFVREGLGFCFFKALLVLLTGQNHVYFNHWRSRTLHTLVTLPARGADAWEYQLWPMNNINTNVLKPVCFIQERRICFAGSSVLVHFLFDMFLEKKKITKKKKAFQKRNYLLKHFIMMFVVTFLLVLNIQNLFW